MSRPYRSRTAPCFVYVETVVVRHKMLAIVAALIGLPVLGCSAAMLWTAATTEKPTPLARTTAHDDSLPSRSIDGYRFHLETHGNPAGPLVVVLHGGPGNDYRYLLPLRPLADDYHLVFYDQRGSGLSPRVPDSELTLARFVADLDAIGRHFSPDAPFRIIGHSWGAMLATAYMAEQPERVTQAVLAEPGFLTPELGDRFLKELDRRTSLGPAAWGAALRAATQALRLPDAANDADARLDYFLGTMARFRGRGNPLHGYFCGGDVANGTLELWRIGGRAMTTLLRGATDEDGHVTLDLSVGARKFPREVLLISGACNDIIGPEIQETHRRLFPHARLAVIENAGHTMFGERPTESLRLIRDYFEAAP